MRGPDQPSTGRECGEEEAGDALERQTDSKSQSGFCAAWRSLGSFPEVLGSHGGFETDRSIGVRGAPCVHW